MAYTPRQLKSIDVALAVGIDVEYNGEKYRIEPLTLGDLAEVVAMRKSDALKMYLDEIQSRDIKAGVRFQDIHNILQRASVTDDLQPSDPMNLLRMATLSIRRGGRPEITEKEVDDLFTDTGFRESVSVVIDVLLHGPMTADKFIEKDSEGDDRPDPTS